MDRVIDEALKSFSEQLKRDWHELGVIDGLIEAEQLMKSLGHEDLALVLLASAEARMRAIDASHERD